MPRISGKQRKVPKKEKAPKTKGKKLGKAQNLPEPDVEDENVIAGVTPVEDTDDEPEVELPAVELAVPFSDGIVAACLNNLVVIPRIGGQEVDILRSFLHYFVVTDTFIGTITTRASFMRKKGGTLL